jgi:hypothetical protein
MSIRLFSQSSVTRLSYERVFFIVQRIFILIHDLIYIHDGGKDCSPILSATKLTLCGGKLRQFVFFFDPQIGYSRNRLRAIVENCLIKP